MNRHEAKKLAETVTLEDLKSMFRNAQEKVTDWTRTSRVNKGATIGTTYNILAFEPNRYATIDEVGLIARKNMIWEFGEYLPGYEKAVAKSKSGKITPLHQDPVFKL
jgi:hypothetical protein